MSVRIFAYKRCSIHPFPKLFVGEPMSYLCCLCLFAYSGVQHFVLLYVSTFLVPCCDVFYDFRIKSMFGSSFLRVVCRGAHVLFMLFVFVWYSGVQHFVLLYVSTFLVPCCDVFYDFRINTMFGSSFLRVVC
jgi:hypothetical protein